MSHMHWMTSFSFIELAIRIFMSSSSRFGFLGTGSPFGHPLIWYWRIDKGSLRFKGNKQFRQNSIVHVHLHRVSEKTVQDCLCQNVVKFPSSLTIVGRQRKK